MNSLRKVLPPSNIVVIGDRAMMTKPNIAKLKEKGLNYLGTLQAGREEREMMRGVGEEEFQSPELVSGLRMETGSILELRGRSSLAIKEKYTSRAIVIKSFHKEEKDRAKRQKALDGISSQLEDIKQKLNTRRYKRAAYVEEMVDKIFSPKGKKGMQRFFEVKLEGDEGKLCFDYHIEEEIAREGGLDGKYILVTSLTSSMDEVLRDYKRMNKMDRRMSFLKGPLKIRPVFLQRDNRIKALVLVNILALMVYSLLEWVASRRGLDRTGRYLFSWFRYFSLVKLEFGDGETVVLPETSSGLKEGQRMILERLGFPKPGYLIAGQEGEGDTKADGFAWRSVLYFGVDDYCQAMAGLFLLALDRLGVEKGPAFWQAGI